MTDTPSDREVSGSTGSLLNSSAKAPPVLQEDADARTKATQRLTPSEGTLVEIPD